MGCATGVVKYLVFIFNLIFALAGLAVLIVGILFKVDMSSEVPQSEEIGIVGAAAMVFIVIGAIIFIIAFFGCCGAIKESSCMLTTYAVILLVLFIIQLAIGIYMFVVNKDNNNSLRNLFFKDFEKDVEKYRNHEDIRRNFDVLQQDMHCCGAHGPLDWKWANGSVPATCCVEKQTPCTPDSNFVFQKGCADKIFENVTTNIQRIGIAAVVIAVTELVGAIFALCLSSSIRNQYRRGVYA